MARIQEKNVRIKKIMKNLQLNETTFNPQTGANEHPELDLTVKDDEVRKKNRRCECVYQEFPSQGYRGEIRF